ncbi:MAG TPA: primosomal protein N', partial [bacterium]|nr:primosomal protein N' [bacterium]
FTYGIPDAWESVIVPGSRVLAPFGRKKITGYVVALSRHSERDQISPIHEALDPLPAFSEDLLKLAEWISDYYMAPLGQVLGAMLPPGMERHGEKLYVLKAVITDFEIKSLSKTKPVQSKILKALYVYKKLTLRQLVKKVGARNLIKNLDELLRSAVVEERDVISDQLANIRTDTWVRLSSLLLGDEERFVWATDELQKRAPKQADILFYLDEATRQSEDEEPFALRQAELLKITEAPYSALIALEKKNWIERIEREVIRDPYQRDYPRPNDVTLNDHQAQAVAAIAETLRNNKYYTWLLYGVTGSGKTQVYIESIRQTLALGKNAIVLVPEIALTPQAVERFKAHFGDQVAVLHSRMTMGERFDSWRKLQSGHFRIAIGARSAVFAPVQNLGLIVVDEEHEHTYKQQDNIPPYHARDAAIMRASFCKATVILGSATPSIESYYNATTQKYGLLKLPIRINDVPMPEVEVVNMREEYEKHTSDWQPILSRALRQRMKEELQHRRQAILFQNRRGYSSSVECFDCGHVAECPRCSIALTYHITGHKLRCHYCGFHQPMYSECPKCDSLSIAQQGIGTQKVEEQLQMAFPNAGVLRMDVDSTSAKGAHHRILEEFKNKNALILLGTQMVTKGLDFENVTVVGVISADTSLLLPDFRAGERTFQLLTQVAGRAGRKNKIGHVIIQTMHPDRAAIRHARQHDFTSFFNEEISIRHDLLYPPFGRLMLIQIRSEDEQKAVELSSVFSDILAGEIKRYPDLASGVAQLGPTPAPIVKIRNYFRYHILLKVDKEADRSGSRIRSILRHTRKQVISRIPSGAEIRIDADPLSLL